MKKNSPVVDTCIARSAKQDSKSTQALVSWSCLQTIRTNKVVITLTSQLIDEWRRNAPKPVIAWLGAMTSSSLTKTINVKALHSSLEMEIFAAVSNKHSRASMIKDLHLFCAAIRSDGIIISYNKKEFISYKRNLAGNKKIQNLQWVDPLKHADVIKWIKAGLPHAENRKVKNSV